MRTIPKGVALACLITAVGLGIVEKRALVASSKPIESPQDGQAPGAEPLPEGKDLIYAVEGKSTILSLVPEGSKVNPGDLVCELDSSIWQLELENQEIATRTAELKLENARKRMEAAEINRRIEEEQRLPFEEQRAERRLEIAGAEFAYAKDALAHLLATEAEALTIRRARLDHLKAKYELEDAEADLLDWREYERPTRLLHLQHDIERARSDILAGTSNLEFQEDRLERLRRQVEKCKIYAPISGFVHYWHRDGVPPIEVWGEVRERQPIVRIVPEPSTER